MYKIDIRGGYYEEKTVKACLYCRIASAVYSESRTDLRIAVNFLQTVFKSRLRSFTLIQTFISVSDSPYLLQDSIRAVLHFSAVISQNKCGAFVLIFGHEKCILS